MRKAASFPCYEYDSPFSSLIRRYKVEQYHMLKTCLGRDYFYSHESPRLRAAHGFVFLKQMEAGEFLEHSQALQKQVEMKFEVRKVKFEVRVKHGCMGYTAVFR